MTEQSEPQKPEVPASRPQRSLWIAWCACGWAWLFAAFSFFWAAGGRTGLHPLEQQGNAQPFLWILVNVSAGVCKVLGGLMVIALARSSGKKWYRTCFALLAWVGGAGMLCYGFFGLISDILHVTGIIHDPQSWKWFLYYLIVWDPWWMLGGALFLATARSVRRRDRIME